MTYTPKNFTIRQKVIYDGNYYHHGVKLPPQDAEVLQLGEKRVKIYVYSRDYGMWVECWVDPKSLTPTRNPRAGFYPWRERP